MKFVIKLIITKAANNIMNKNQIIEERSSDEASISIHESDEMPRGGGETKNKRASMLS